MFVVTANRLLDGVVVFLGPASRWFERLQLAHLFTEREEAEKAKDAQDHGALISLEVIAVEEDKIGVIRPLRLRERIRAEGPTINPFDGIDLQRFPIEPDMPAQTSD